MYELVSYGSFSCLLLPWYRLRVVLEHERFTAEDEFQVTSLGRSMWEQLQHPLEMFGRQSPMPVVSNTKAGRLEAQTQRRLKLLDEKQRWLQEIKPKLESRTSSAVLNDSLSKLYGPDFRQAVAYRRGAARVQEQDTTRAYKDISSRRFTVDRTVVPFVFMVYERVSYFEKAIDSLRQSDFPKEVPLVISHDGKVPEMMEFVDSLKSEFKVLQLFHPFSCYDHPNTFPGDDPTLNDGFAGDKYGNPRSPWATCCKHHFTWLLNAVFSMHFDETVHNFLFIEEDYVLAPTAYSTIVNGLNAIDQFEKEDDFVGVGLDCTEAGSSAEPFWIDDDAFFADIFRSGPMTMNRAVYRELRDHADDYCNFDDYNWDWSLVHTYVRKCLALCLLLPTNTCPAVWYYNVNSAENGHIPNTILLPSRSQAKHIGLKDGMHADRLRHVALRALLPQFKNHSETIETRFEGKRLFESAKVGNGERRKGFGGWGHPADREHCLKVFRQSTHSSTEHHIVPS